MSKNLKHNYMQAILLKYPPGFCDFRNEFEVYRGSWVLARDEFEVFRGSWVPARNEFEVFRGSWVPARDEFEVFRGSKNALLRRISSMPKLQILHYTKARASKNLRYSGVCERMDSISSMPKLQTFFFEPLKTSNPSWGDSWEKLF